MLSIEVRVNGAIVSALQACNRGPASARNGELYLYEYQATQFPLDMKGAPITWSGLVHHRRTDGIAPLVAKLTAALTVSGDPK